jgi:uncharacterized protein (DUF427 family)
VRVGNHVSENAVWAYETPFDEGEVYAGYLAFYWGRVDHWFEEDEEIFVHARSPYKRVDAILSDREVRVVLGGETVAESSRAHFLFETGMPTRYYIPQEDVRMDLLTASETTTSCPYKGDASYWTANIGDEEIADIVWSYPKPLAECGKIEGLLCFYNERVDEVFVDGVATGKPPERKSYKRK